MSPPPAVADIALQAAATALAENRLPEAERLLHARLQQQPGDVTAIRMLAQLASRRDLHELAEALLARCLELAPELAEARHEYALALYHGNKPQAALVAVEGLLAREPGNPAWRNLQAVVLSRLGDDEAAIRIFSDLLSGDAGHAGLWLSFGHVLKAAGHLQRGIEAYRRAIHCRPGFGDAWWSLANLKTFRFEPADLQGMRAALAQPDADTVNRSHLHFALGKALEDQQEYADSFAHYAQGNALRRAVLAYDPERHTARIGRICNDYRREFFTARSGWGCPAADPVFIVGMPRAGSTLLEQILASHPSVEGTRELPEVMALSRELRALGERPQDPDYAAVLRQLEPAQIRRLGEHYLERARTYRRTDAPLFIDKMPNNYLHIALIHLMLPNAKIIDVRRHPLACCFSNFRQDYTSGHNFSYRLDELGRCYRDYVRVMAHFDAALPGRVHRVFYEDLVAHTEREVRRVLDYCGLRFDPHCLRFFDNARTVHTASSEQVRQPVYRTAVDHWQHFERWLQPLKDALGEVLPAYPAVPGAWS